MIDKKPETALFDQDVQGLVFFCYENERPLQRLAGTLDWYFRGQISHYVREGVITGQEGECVYMIVVHGGRLFHLFSLGGDTSTKQKGKKGPDSKTIQKLKENVSNLKLKKIGVSAADFGEGLEELPNSFGENFRLVQ